MSSPVLTTTPTHTRLFLPIHNLFVEFFTEEGDGRTFHKHWKVMDAKKSLITRYLPELGLDIIFGKAIF